MTRDGPPLRSVTPCAYRRHREERPYPSRAAGGGVSASAHGPTLAAVSTTPTEPPERRLLVMAAPPAGKHGSRTCPRTRGGPGPTPSSTRWRPTTGVVHHLRREHLISNVRQPKEDEIRTRRRLVLTASVVLALACAACSTGTVQWPASLVTSVENSCMQGGGAATACGCAVRYLEDHAVDPSSMTGSTGQQNLDEATKACLSQINSGNSGNTGNSGNS